MSFLRHFTEDYSPRASATDEELRAAEFLASEFEALGYATEIQPFTVEREVATVRVGADDRDVRSIHMTLSGRGEASGPLVDVGRARVGDLPARPLTGKIALIQRGEITFAEKAERVAGAGAAGAIVYNNVEGIFAGRLADQASIPVVSISQEDGEAILRQMADGEVESSVSVLLQEGQSRNLIAERVGTDPEPKIVVLGGHYDTVPDVPGANDNGSGIAALLAIADELSESDHPMTLRFIAFGSEETGLHGSRHYVGQLTLEERLDIEMMLNFDSVGTGAVVGVLGDSELVTAILDVAREEGILASRRPPLRAGVASDHTSFEEAGIPVAFLLGDDISRIHTPEDRLEFVVPELLGESAALTASFVESLADR